MGLAWCLKMEKQQNNECLKMCKDILGFGDLLLIAEKSHGKTHSLMHLARQFKTMENVKVIIFEDFPKLMHQFDVVPYMFIKDNDVVETSHTVNLEDYFIKHERDYTVKKGLQIREFLTENNHCLFTMGIRDIERSAFFIYSVVNHFYRKHYLTAYKYGTDAIKEHVVIIIEESQNVFDSSTISKKLFNRMRKIFSVSRNLKIHFVLCSQRLQDLNTKIRSRTRLMFGKIGIDDYTLKVERLLKNSKYQKDVLHFPKGVYLYPSQDRIISFPIFKQDSKPYEYKFKPIPQPQPKKGLLQKLKEAFSSETLEQQLNRYDKEDEENTDIEEEEDAILF